jgi:hypothetical protein
VILGGLIGGLMSDVLDQLSRFPLYQYNNHLSVSSGFALSSANHCINEEIRRLYSHCGVMYLLCLLVSLMFKGSVRNQYFLPTVPGSFVFTKEYLWAYELRNLISGIIGMHAQHITLDEMKQK